MCITLQAGTVVLLCHHEHVPLGYIYIYIYIYNVYIYNVYIYICV